ncbi:arginine--tRNA ligase [Butyrivibrio sp. XB500-5]|uniref:arginine--tRNA ligase n=1 Tax=Butyrivibrio sp. XB500-5 TaxID=2364880 RepID=UPI000EA8E26E|nr:arginine--tRNA ligase [Butyrivibrio sp. XB500-5]RKM62837.1 arginine--tRNA ligase [Butyrivibrio sp. XB500-5]
MKDDVSKVVANVIGSMNESQIQELFETPPDSSMGDLAIPCFQFAKIMHKNPAVIAEEIKDVLEEHKNEFGIDHLEANGAYCNLFFDREKYVKTVLTSIEQDNFGVEKTGAGKTICIDYSSPNIAKNFHVGHLRTTVIGNSLYKIFDKLGYNIVRINHLGDWGTQFGKLIVAYKKWSSKEAVEEKGIEELLDIYVKFNNEAKEHPELMDEARSWFVKMEEGDEDALAIWEWFKEISMIEFERVYKMLGMEFDSYTGESFYREKVPALAVSLKEKGLLIESQGANVIDLSEYDMPPCMITKKDGSSIYHSRDIAAVLYRKEKYDFEKCLYVTGLEQTLHFKQVFKAIELMGNEWYGNLVHIPYGLVSLEGEKLSTRTGNIIYAEDILNEAVKRAKQLIEEKNPGLSDKDNVAKQVGIGAVIFHDLFNQRIKNIDFSWDAVLSFEGTTGPYVQYTNARAGSILRKYGKKLDVDGICYASLTDDVSYELIKTLTGYEKAVKSAAMRYEPSVIARFLVSLSTAFNKFYQECKILKEENESTKVSRLYLVQTVQKIIIEGCSLLGIQCPEEM